LPPRNCQSRKLRHLRTTWLRDTGLEDALEQIN